MRMLRYFLLGSMVALAANGCGLFTEEHTMSMLERREPDARLTPAQQKMVEMWEKHVTAEFEAHSLDATLATMTETPSLVNVPVMTGGVGLKQVRDFYGTLFIPNLPDSEIIRVSRTVGYDRIVDEIIHKFTHSMEMPWILPGIPPTGKRVEVAVVVIVEFRDGKIASEHIHWDQASVLAQLGLIDSSRLPVGGAETARKLVDPSVPSNELIKRAARPNK